MEVPLWVFILFFPCSFPGPTAVLGPDTHVGKHLSICRLTKRRRIPGGHMTFIQRRIDVDKTL